MTDREVSCPWLWYIQWWSRRVWREITVVCVKGCISCSLSNCFSFFVLFYKMKPICVVVQLLFVILLCRQTYFLFYFLYGCDPHLLNHLYTFLFPNCSFQTWILQRSSALFLDSSLPSLESLQLQWPGTGRLPQILPIKRSSTSHISFHSPSCLPASNNKTISLHITLYAGLY